MTRTPQEITAAHDLLRAQAAWQEQYGATAQWKWSIQGAYQALAWVLGLDNREMAVAGWLSDDVRRYLATGYSDLPLFKQEVT